MTDHVARMVHSWVQRAQAKAQQADGEATTYLIDSIHRLIREAEDQTRRRCEEAALRAADSDAARRVVTAIRAIRAAGTAGGDGGNG